MTPKKTLVYFLIIFLVVLAVGLIWSSNHRAVNRGAKPTNSQSQAKPPVTAGPGNLEVQAVPPGQLPDGLPKDLPIESGANILLSHNVVDSSTDSRQADETYTSKLTLAQNFAAWQKYFSDNKWQSVTLVDQANYKALHATKANGSLDIYFHYETTPGQVGVYYVYKPVSTAPSTKK